MKRRIFVILGVLTFILSAQQADWIRNIKNKPFVDVSSIVFNPQTPAGAISIGANTVTLKPCPLGVNGTDSNHFYLLSNPTEVVLGTGGSCTSGLSTGTITFTVSGNHSHGYTIQSATANIQEAIQYAGKGTVYIPAGTYSLYAHPVVYSNINFAGNGIGSTILQIANGQWPSSSTAPAWVGFATITPMGLITATAATNVQFHDFTFDENGANQGNKTYGTDVDLDNATYSTIYNVHVINSYHSGQQFGDEGGSGHDNQILNSAAIGPGVVNSTCVTNIGVGGFFIQNQRALVQGNFATGLCDEAFVANNPLADNVMFRNNTLYKQFSQAASAPNGFHAENSSNTSFIGNICVGFTASCFNAAPSGVSGASQTNITYIGNSCGPDESGNAPTTCFQASPDGNGHIVSSVVIQGNTGHGTFTNGIVVNATDADVSHNNISGGTNGVVIQANATYSRFTNNIVISNTNDFVGALPTGTIASPNIVSANATTNVVVGQIQQATQLNQITSLGQDTGTSYSEISPRTANGTFRINTNLNPDDDTTLRDNTKPGYSYEQNVNTDLAALSRKPVGGGAVHSIWTASTSGFTVTPSANTANQYNGISSPDLSFTRLLASVSVGLYNPLTISGDQAITHAGINAVIDTGALCICPYSTTPFGQRFDNVNKNLVFTSNKVGVTGVVNSNRVLTPFGGTNQTLTAVIMTGGIIVGTPTGAANYTTDSAANIVANLPGCNNGMTFPMEIRNTSGGANTITVLAGMNVTLAGTMTIAQNNFRDFLVWVLNCGTPQVTIYAGASGAF